MSCQQVPTTPAFNPYPRSVQVGEFEVAIGGGIWVAIGANNPGNASATVWPDNRIGYSAEHAWRYDAFGNRAEQLSEDGRRQTLAYDGAHQLIEVKVQGPVIGSESNAADIDADAGQASTTTRYRYDAPRCRGR